MKLRLVATAAFGLESVVDRELRSLGYEDTAVENGRVAFTADASGIARSNIWLRCADRVLLSVGVFPAKTFDELFEGCKALPWPEWLPRDAAFPVTGRSAKSVLHSVPDCQAIVKKSIVESMKAAYGLDRFPETGGEFPVHVSLMEDTATITIDTSGAGLHKRGYREAVGIAPLKETLAAGMLYLSRWAPHRPLIDPFCGSGTIPIEAALMGANIAPGGTRSFVSETWPMIGAETWRAARAEAKDLVKQPETLDILGADIDSEAVTLATEHARLAHVGLRVKFQCRPVRTLKTSARYGCIVGNPPYGERVGTLREAEQAYRDLRYALEPMDTWSVFILTAYKGFERILARKATKKRRLYNGPIECTYYQFLGPLPPRE